MSHWGISAKTTWESRARSQPLKRAPPLASWSCLARARATRFLSGPASGRSGKVESCVEVTEGLGRDGQDSLRRKAWGPCPRWGLSRRSPLKTPMVLLEIVFADRSGEVTNALGWPPCGLVHAWSGGRAPRTTVVTM